MNKNKILIILGPTSSGKSDIAIKLAKKFDGEIISADSRQVYREMDIGSGKVHLTRNKKNETLSNGVRHYMLDIVSPRADYNVAKFKKQSEKIISDILKCGKLPIVCGGTGFWIQSVVDNVNFPEVKPDWKMRKRLEKYPAEKLFTMLKKKDPKRADNIDSKNKVRLIRAIEICRNLGKVPDKKCDAKNEGRDFLQIGIKLSKEKLSKNIEKRVKQRFNQGMIREVAKLRADGLSWKKIRSFGLAYFWVPLYLQKKLSKKELAEKIIQAEKKYAKRQMTWFKRNSQIKWLANCEKIEKETRNFLK